MSELRKPYRPGNEEEIPAGLEYRPEMWDSALGLIENHEKVVFRRKLLMAAGVLLLLALGTGFWDRNISSDGAQMAQQQDVFFAELRDTQVAETDLASQSSTQVEVDVTLGDVNQQYVATTDQLDQITESNPSQLQSAEDNQALAIVSEANHQDEVSPAQVNEFNADAEVSEVNTNVINETQVTVPSAEAIEINGAESEIVTEVNVVSTQELDDNVAEDTQYEETTDQSTAIAAESAISTDKDNPAVEDSREESNTNLPEGIISENTVKGVQIENPIPLNIKQINEEDSPLQYEPFAEGAPAPHAFSTEFMRLGQELEQMDPRPYALIANSTDFKKPQGVIVNLKTKELLLPLQQFNVQVMLGTSILSHYGSRKGELALSPTAGVGVDYNFKRRLSFNAQLEYFSVKNIQRDRVVVQEEIDFSLATTTFTYNTEKLHYVSVPVNIAMRFKNRHQFSVGGGMSYLIAANNKVKVEEESSLVQANVSEYEVKNVADGFAPINTYLNFGYNYYVTPNVTLGLRYQAGLTDVTLDDSGLFNNNRKDRNTRLAAYVRFNVF